MLITQLVEISKSRTKVYLDYEFVFVLYKGELRRYGIIEGEELGIESYNEIMETILSKRVKLRCMNLLTKKTYTEAQLREKLKNDYQEELIKEAIEYVKSYGYVDDRQYAMDYINYRQETKSQKQMELYLRKRGIKSDIIQYSMEECINNIEEQERAALKRLLSKKQYKQEETSREEGDKIIQFLLRKGFEYSMIKSVMNEYL